ncbi:MAG TPA: TOMM precursor leader peptide-binding protein, partial [Rhizomicrobium sp.]
GFALGPLVEPETPGCMTCLRHAERKNNQARNDRETMRLASSGGRAAGPAAVPPAVGDVLSGILASMVSDWMAQGRAPHLSGNYVHLTYEPAIGAVRHRFSADPECPDCGHRPHDSEDLARIAFQARPKPSPREYRTANPRIGLRNLADNLVDWRSGFIRSTFQNVASSILPIVAAEAPMLGMPQPETGYGRTKTLGGSRQVAILETLERYSGRQPRGKRTVRRASFADCGPRAIDPRRFVLHREEQQHEPGYALVPYHDDLEIAWIWAHSMRRDDTVLLPEQLAFYALRDQPGVPVNRFVSEISNGCAMGSSLEEAVFYGLLEVVERDAFLTSWYGGLPGVRLDLDTVDDPAIRAINARCSLGGFDLHVFDIGLEFGVPAIEALIVDTQEDTPIKTYCAAGAHPDPEAAIFGALVETVTSMALYKRTFAQARDRARELLDDMSKVQAMEDHIVLFSNPQMLPRLDYLFAGDAVPVREHFKTWHGCEPSDDLAVDLSQLVRAVLEVADDILIVDQTSALLRQFGLVCVKVLAPGLSTVTFGHQYRRIPDERVARARKLPRFRGVAFPPGLNLTPHNFP